jgi:hypothetical protein
MLLSYTRLRRSPLFIRHSEIDRAMTYWKSKGGVSIADLDKAEKYGQARAQIFNNRVRRSLASTTASPSQN